MKRHKQSSKPVATVIGRVLLVLLGLVLVAAPLHEAAHHNHDSQHPCAVCSFAKSLVEAPQLSLLLIPAVLVGLGCAVRSISQFVPSSFFLLPPGRAPPVLSAGF